MATTHENDINIESDGAHVIFLRDCPHGLTGESKWLSASTARNLIANGFAVESDPAPKAAYVDIEAEVRAKADANGQVFFRVIATGLILQMHWDVAVQKIRQGVADLV